MFNRPDRIKAGFVGDSSDIEFLPEDVPVFSSGPIGYRFATLLGFVSIPVVVVLVENACPDAH
ncbi:unannotated protein [freshwater metagenome]|uniref:Unannotated protein n=1 Tax=freshwater metagenome TaxID=449393 RepID=A0A6J6YM99_9ZZZZ